MVSHRCLPSRGQWQLLSMVVTLIVGSRLRQSSIFFWLDIITLLWFSRKHCIRTIISFTFTGQEWVRLQCPDAIKTIHHRYHRSYCTLTYMTMGVAPEPIIQNSGKEKNPIVRKAVFESQIPHQTLMRNGDTSASAAFTAKICELLGHEWEPTEFFHRQSSGARQQWLDISTNSSLTENPLLNTSHPKAANMLCTTYYILHRNIDVGCYFTIELIPSDFRATLSLATLVPELPNNNFGKRVIWTFRDGKIDTRYHFLKPDGPIVGRFVGLNGIAKGSTAGLVATLNHLAMISCQNENKIEISLVV